MRDSSKNLVSQPRFAYTPFHGRQEVEDPRGRYQPDSSSHSGWTVRTRRPAADRHGLVWFASSTEIGYLSKVNGKYQIVKVYDGSLGAAPSDIADGDCLYVASEAGLLDWDKGHFSQHPWPTATMTTSSATGIHGKIRVADETGSIYEFDGRGFSKIVEPPPINAGKVRAIVDCPIGDGLIVEASGFFKKDGTTLLRWPTEIDGLLKSSEIYSARWILDKYLAILVQDRGVYLLNRQGQLVESFTVTSGLADGVALVMIGTEVFGLLPIPSSLGFSAQLELPNLTMS